MVEPIPSQMGSRVVSYGWYYWRCSEATDQSRGAYHKTTGGITGVARAAKYCPAASHWGDTTRRSWSLPSASSYWGVGISRMTLSVPAASAAA